MMRLSAQELEAAVTNPHQAKIQEQFPDMDWDCLRWLCLVADHLIIQSARPTWGEHANTYRDFTGITPGIDDDRVIEILTGLIIILVQDTTSVVSIERKGSQVIFGLLPPPA